MNKYWLYFKYLLKHKYHVWKGCQKYNVPFWIAILHDWDKIVFPYMFISFAKNYYGTDDEKQKNKNSYYQAWNDHQKRNKHHLEYWICLNPDSFSDGYELYLEMPLVYVREMLADWYSAGITKHGKNDIVEWYDKHRYNMKINAKTKQAIEFYLKMKG